MESETQAASENGTIAADDGTPETNAPETDGGAAAELAAALALAEERLNELAYARAEIDNVRKRAQRIADERLSHGRKQLLGKFLPVLDNLQRSLAFNDSEALRGGLQATLKGFESLLSSEQVVAVETVGKPFDPRVAEAIGTRESSEYDDDVVLEEAQRGYRLGEELLRPALVLVAKRVPATGA
jgi:molecular chaperone GrpE